MIKKILRKRHASHYLALLRGAGKLKNKNNPCFVADKVAKLSGVCLDLSENKFPEFLVGKHAKICELHLRQILMLKNEKLTSSIVKAYGTNSRASLPLPKIWLHFLENEGIPICHFGSRVSFFKTKFIAIVKSLFVFIKLMMQKKLIQPPGVPYVVFAGLKDRNIRNEGASRYTVINWYSGFLTRNSQIKKIFAQTDNIRMEGIPDKVHIVRFIFPKCERTLRLFLFFFFSIATFFRVVIGTFIGRWWYALLYSESLQLKYISLLPVESLAMEYFFHNSSWFYKPLWLEEAEYLGSKVSIYYYSTNGEPVVYLEEGKFISVPIPFGLKSMTWNNFYVWDRRHMEFLKQFSPNAVFSCVGIIDFSDSVNDVETNFNQLNIAAFDITPMRESFYSALGFSIPMYYSEPLVMKFIGDIQDIFSDQDEVVYLKRKRIVDNRFISSHFYKKFEKIKNNNVVEVNPEIAARKLVDKCDVVISLPFTSTALIGTILGKESIYYDPSGTVEFTTENHGIPVIRGIGELEIWAKRIKREYHEKKI